MDARLVLKGTGKQTTVIEIAPGVTVGDKQLLIVGGPCTVESREQMEEVSRVLRGSVSALRGGVFKPRTSPYAFQGMREEGVKLLSEISRESGIPVVTEVMSESHIEICDPVVDMLQIGSRNMQNFELLKAAGKAKKPVILKRGLAATIEEFIMAAEYIMSEGNHNVILCERGIRSFDSFTRNVLDLGAVVALKQLTHLPVIVDPSHAAGKRELVPDLALAAIACGADGVMIECHPVPEESVSDARQALSLQDMVELVKRMQPIAEARGRSIGSSKPAPKEFSITSTLAASMATREAKVSAA
ncbi:MAG: 3-deoxy-7-phosphoheptulonate synthase [Candidatus Melainabacteria bacterium]|nr:3-deoxy-7-phosphoheptulonate synthase [Candidatus Melainabacteria bacterium]